MSECNFADDQPALNLRNTHLDPDQALIREFIRPEDMPAFAEQCTRRALYGYEHDGVKA